MQRSRTHVGWIYAPMSVSAASRATQLAGAKKSVVAFVKTGPGSSLITPSPPPHTLHGG